MTLVTLFCFGVVKVHFTGIGKLRGDLQTVIVCGLTAGAAVTGHLGLIEDDGSGLE